jgi:hypothetical protein
LDAAGAEALVASMISRRPFLPEADGPWARERRRWRQAVRIRALECLSDVWRRKGDHGQAARDAETILRPDPTARPRTFGWCWPSRRREPGQRAADLRALPRPPRRGPERLPKPAIQALHLELLRAR